MSRFFLCIIIVLLAGCDFWGNLGGATGSLDDNYVEEPLDGPFDRYSDALSVSNTAMTFLEERQPGMLYEKLFSDGLKSKLTSAEFSRNINQFLQKLGGISEFKEMQWAFFPKEVDGKPKLRSIKIAKHEAVYVAYIFVFYGDDRYEQISEFQVYPLEGKSLKAIISG